MDNQTRTGRKRAPDSTALAYSLDQAAQLIGVSRRTIYTLIAEGQLPSKKIRARRVITRAALEAFLTQDDS